MSVCIHTSELWFDKIVKHLNLRRQSKKKKHVNKKIQIRKHRSKKLTEAESITTVRHELLVGHNNTHWTNDIHCPRTDIRHGGRRFLLCLHFLFQKNWIITRNLLETGLIKNEIRTPLPEERGMGTVDPHRMLSNSSNYNQNAVKLVTKWGGYKRKTTKKTDTDDELMTDSKKKKKSFLVSLMIN